MRDTDFAQRLLSAFTSADRAEAIAGDLTEERHERGSIWFWRQVFATAIQLWRNAFTAAPVPMLALAGAGCVRLAELAFAGAAAIGLFPLLVDSVAGGILLLLFWSGAALWTGASLVRLSPTGGLAACVTLALAGEALLITLGMISISRQAPSLFASVIYAIAVLAFALIPAGGAIMCSRTINLR